MLLVAALFAVLAFSAQADINGKARVIDGDTIEIAGQRIRLYGIDAPESKQTCEHGGEAWPCGFEATNALAPKPHKDSINGSGGKTKKGGGHKDRRKMKNERLSS